MKKLTDPQKIATLDNDIRAFWKNIQTELAAGHPFAVAANNFWKEYCGIDFNIDFDTLNLPCRYMEAKYRSMGVIYFMVGNKSFRFNSYHLMMVRKRNPHVYLLGYNAERHKALYHFNCQMLFYTRENEILTSMQKHVA